MTALLPRIQAPTLLLHRAEVEFVPESAARHLAADGGVGEDVRSVGGVGDSQAGRRDMGADQLIGSEGAG